VPAGHQRSEQVPFNFVRIHFLGYRAMKRCNRIRMQRVYDQAEGYLELGMPRHALDVLARLSGRPDVTPYAFYLRGSAFLTLGQFQEALESLQRSAELAPENGDVWLAMGCCYKRTGQLTSAISSLRHAAAVEPNRPIVHYNLACYLSLAGDKRGALAHLARALDLEPSLGGLARKELDFGSLRSDPYFQALISLVLR